MNEKLKQLYTLLEKMDWLSHAIEVINYDIETQAPKKGMEDDARDITFLSNERFRIHSSDEFRKLVKELKKEQDSLDTYNQRGGCCRDCLYHSCPEVRHISSEVRISF